MQRHHWARLGVLSILFPWLVAAAAIGGYFLLLYWAEHPRCSCTTDTECMQMHGGDGGPDTTTSQES